MDNSQMSLALLGDCKRAKKHVDPTQVRDCSEVADALRLAYDHSTISFSQVELGKLLGLGNGSSFKAWLKPKRSTTRPRHFDFNLVDQLENLVGNDVMSQWINYKLNHQLFCQMAPEAREAAIKEALYQKYTQQA